MIVQYWLSPLITPGGFGFPRWMYSFVDVVAVPALAPLVICLLLVLLRVFPRNVDYAGFALLWLFPLAVVRSISGSLPPSPLSLVVVPLLWASQAMSIPFFAGCIVKKPRWYVMVPSALCIAALPVIAATSWWALFSHVTFPGLLLLILSLVPAVISLGSRLWETSGRSLSDREREVSGVESRE